MDRKYEPFLIALLVMGIVIDIELLIWIFLSIDVKAFLSEWQDLIGSLVGAAAPLILYLLTINYFDRKEALRKIEITNTYTLQSLVNMQHKIDFFIKQMEGLAIDFRTKNNPLSRINSPAWGNIYFDPEGHNARIKSYYLHNKILIINGNIADTNLALGNFRSSFEELKNLSETIITLNQEAMRDATIRKQICDGFAEQTENFAKSLKGYADGMLPKAVKHSQQIRVYNKELRKKWFRGFLFRVFHEGLINTKSIELVDEIDQRLEPLIQKENEIISKRIKKLREEANAN